MGSTPSSHIIDNNRIITKDTVEAKPPISDDIDLNINDDKTNIQQRQSARQQQQKQRSTTSPLLPLPHKLKFFITTTFHLAMPSVHLFPSASLPVSLWILKIFFMTRNMDYYDDGECYEDEGCSNNGSCYDDTGDDSYDNGGCSDYS